MTWNRYTTTDVSGTKIKLYIAIILIIFIAIVMECLFMIIVDGQIHVESEKAGVFIVNIIYLMYSKYQRYNITMLFCM